MKIVFCREGFRAIQDMLQSLLPDAELVCCAPEDITRVGQDADVLIPAITPLGEAELSLPRLKLVQQFGAGLDAVDIPAASKNGVYVANVPAAGTGNAESVAEVAVMLMLTLARQFPKAQKNIRDAVVAGPTGWSLKGRTALIVGYGGIGHEVARRLSGFEMEVLAVSHSGPKNTAQERAIPLAQHSSGDALHELLPRADFVILAPPLNDATRGLIAAAEFALMKPTAFVVNVARGGVIDYEALLDALKKKQITGAGLDVFWQEPVDPNDPLFNYNIIATPHIGGATDLSFKGIASKVAENIRRVERAEMPLNCVNASDCSGSA
ncbi:MAG: 2-hydroxyacid dehydrogenase [Gammaproteobacteria bacterium]|nr:2-hydroxyacid dehydrogenase [Gammaproteobacteria bacterium]MBQ0840629.1 2-hydroxyacid dehydrogenase [Gammaproteobacteria bacterium]